MEILATTYSELRAAAGGLALVVSLAFAAVCTALFFSFFDDPGTGAGGFDREIDERNRLEYDARQARCFKTAILGFVVIVVVALVCSLLEIVAS